MTFDDFKHAIGAAGNKLAAFAAASRANRHISLDQQAARTLGNIGLFVAAAALQAVGTGMRTFGIDAVKQACQSAVADIGESVVLMELATTRIKEAQQRLLRIVGGSSHTDVYHNLETSHQATRVARLRAGIAKRDVEQFIASL